MLIRVVLAVLTCALASAAAPPSFAADMPAGRYREPADVAPYFAWNGFYVGLNAGYGWGTSDWTSSFTSGSNSPGGGMFGGTLGFNAQYGNFVFGLEGDVSGNWMRDFEQQRHGHLRCAWLRDPDQLVRNRARTHRICVRPRTVLCHRGWRVRRRSNADEWAHRNGGPRGMDRRRRP